MKKLLMMLGFALLTIAVYSQEPGSNEWWRQINVLGCRGTENLEQCKARIWRKKSERQRYEDSVKREQDFLLNKWKREEWAKEKERRDKLSPEERMKEDEDRQRGRQEEEQDKKLSKTGKTNSYWDFYFAAILSTKTGNTPNYDPVTGVQFGVETQVIPISEDISLGVGAAYSMQGGKYKSSDYIPGGNYSTTSRTSRLNYLNFPVMVRYQRQRNGFFAEAGLQPGLLLSAKDKGSTTTDIKDEVKKFDVGIPIGVGYKFKNKFGVGLRITPGLININKDKQYNNRNMVASMRASYSL